MTAPTAPTRADIEVARQAWLGAGDALSGHLDSHSCRSDEDCAEYARLDAQERVAWRAFERTKGGHRGYL